MRQLLRVRTRSVPWLTIRLAKYPRGRCFSRLQYRDSCFFFLYIFFSFSGFRPRLVVPHTCVCFLFSFTHFAKARTKRTHESPFRIRLVRVRTFQFLITFRGNPRTRTSYRDVHVERRLRIERSATAVAEYTVLRPFDS